MVGLFGSGRRSQSLPEIDEGSEEISGEIKENREPSSKRKSSSSGGGGWFGGGKGDEPEGGDTTTDEEDGDGGRRSSRRKRATEDDSDSQSIRSSRGGRDGESTTTRQSKQKHVETIPDNENEFHLAIQEHDWDGLDMLLRDYDFKIYKKEPPKPKKKNAKKLRVAKYLPEMPELPWKKQKVVPISPLFGLDELGRTPLHLCCLHPVPNKLLVRLLFVARDAASVTDHSNNLPIHLAVNHRRGVEVIDKLVRGYYQGSWQTDGMGKTSFMWSVEMSKLKQEEENPPRTSTFWGFPSMKGEQEWQQNQERCWAVTAFLIENRHARRKKLIPQEYKQIIHCLGLAAPPKVIELLQTTGIEAFKKEEIAGPAMSLFITRQYPLEMLEKLIDVCPVGMPKLHKDSTGRGLVSSHYKVGCVSHQDPDDPSYRRESFRMTMQRVANSKHESGDHDFVPPAPYLDWWSKLKFLIHLWGSHPKPGGGRTSIDGASMDDIEEDEEEEEPEFDEDDLLIHSALSNPDVPPSLIQLLAMMHPSSLDFEHPKSTALPLHLACRLWRYRQFPPRRGEKEIGFDKVVVQLLHGDNARTRKRYKDRLPLQHAIASGKNWFFVKPMVVTDLKSLHVRDPTTKLYPFQLAASRSDMKFDLEGVTRQQYTPAQWNKLRDYEQDHECNKVEHFYDLEQLTLIFELLKHSPDAIDHLALRDKEQKKIASGPKRLIIVEGIEASEEVATSMQIKMIRAQFGLGNISGHFISWCYESTRRGWKTHRSNFAVVKEAIMDGFIPTQMDKWWRKLKFWIWQDCPWENIPRRDDFLVHGALCNPDTSPWIIELLLECFPRSASIPIPQSNGCYPLHIACVTDRYIPLPFEFPNKRTVIEMTARAFRDAMLLKWNNVLPLHLAISYSKQWDEISFLAEEETVALAVPDVKSKFFAFQLSALDRPYSREQKRRFETMASKEVGKEQWRGLSGNAKVVAMSKVLETHELGILSCVWELLKCNSSLVTIPIGDIEHDEYDELNEGMGSFISDEEDSFYQELGSSHHSNKEWIGDVDQSNLSVASVDFLEDIYEADNTKKLRKERRKKRANSFDSQSLQFSDMGSSFMGSSEGSGSFNVEQNELGSTEQQHKDRTIRVPAKKETAVTHNKEEDRMDFEEYGDYEEYEELDPNLVDAAAHSESNPSLLTDDPAIQGDNEYEEIDPNYDMVDDAVQSETGSNLTNDPAFHNDYASAQPEEVDPAVAAAASAVAAGAVASSVQNRKDDSNQTDRSLLPKENIKKENPDTEVPALHSTPSGETAADPVKPQRTIQAVNSKDEQNKVAVVLAAAGGSAENPGTTLPDDSLAYRPRRKDIILVTKSSAYVIWKNAVMERGSLKSKAKKNYWLRVLKKLGEDLDISELPMIRYEQEQSTISSLLIDKSSVVIDEDDSYVWLLCGTRSASLVENYDIEAAMEKISFLYDDETLIWLKSFQEGEQDKSLIGSEHPLLVVDTILRLAEAGSYRHDEETRDYLVSRGALRHVFGFEAQEDEGNESSANRLCYDVAGCKLDARLQDLKPVDRQSQSKTSEQEIELLKKLKMKQSRDTQVAKNENAAAPADKGVRSRSVECQPAVVVHHPVKPSKNEEAEKKSLESASSFETTSHRKSRTSGAIFAKIQALRNSSAYKSEGIQDDFFEMSVEKMSSTDLDEDSAEDLAKSLTETQSSKKISQGSHLNNMNQPKIEKEDDDSLDFEEVFDPPKGPPPAKPLLAAAKKAAAAREESKSLPKSSANRASPSSRTRATSSLDPPLIMQPSTSHLQSMNQPKSDEKDDASLELVDVFDAPKGPPPAKPLLTAAKKAAAARSNPRPPGKARSDQATPTSEREIDQQASVQPSALHLQNMNQPRANSDDDDDASLEMMEVFDPPKGPPPARPLLAAAKKAAEQRDQMRGSISGDHLMKMNQPKTSYSGDDDDSLDPSAVFDPPSGPPPAKPLLAAAQKAHQERQKSQSRGDQANSYDSNERQLNTRRRASELIPSDTRLKDESNPRRMSSAFEMRSTPRRSSSGEPPLPEDARPTTPTGILKQPRIVRRESRSQAREKEKKAPSKDSEQNSMQSLTLSAVFDEGGEKDPLERAYRYPTKPRDKLSTHGRVRVPAKKPADSADTNEMGHVMNANLVRMNSIEKGLGSPDPKNKEIKKKKKTRRKSKKEQPK